MDIRICPLGPVSAAARSRVSHKKLHLGDAQPSRCFETDLTFKDLYQILEEGTRRWLDIKKER